MLKYVCEFTVTGGGVFPMDMLRYDRCSPFSNEDTKQISIDQSSDQRTVHLIRFTEGKGRNFNDKPAAARWASMGWKVGEVEYRKI